jgi:hypothetical protein
VRDLVAGHATLLAVAEAMLAARETLFGEWQKLEKRLRSLAREDSRVRRLMTTPGVGTIVALTYVSAIDDPGRFRSSKTVGAHFGLTPKKYQSGETDVTWRISKIGDGGVRAALYEAANVILTRPVKGSTLKLGDAFGGSCRAGMRKAKRHQPPEQGPVAPTMDQVRPHDPRRRRKDDRALLDWPTCSSSDPIRWRPGADQARHRRQDHGSEGLTKLGPVTEADHLGERVP